MSHTPDACCEHWTLSFRSLAAYVRSDDSISFSLDAVCACAFRIRQQTSAVTTAFASHSTMSALLWPRISSLATPVRGDDGFGLAPNNVCVLSCRGDDGFGLAPNNVQHIRVPDSSCLYMSADCVQCIEAESKLCRRASPLTTQAYIASRSRSRAKKKIRRLTQLRHSFITLGER